MKQVSRKKIEDLNLLDDFLFYEVVSGEEGEKFCRLLLQAICKKEIGDIEIRPQRIIQGVDTDYHGVRMDLYVNEEDTGLYDIEPDQHTSREVLPRRNRYYRALLDGKLLNTGEGFEYLPEVWTIFILPYDPFGKGRMCYTVRNNILEEPDVEYEDGAVSLFLYTRGKTEENEELSRILHYIEDSVEENAVTDELRELHKYVLEIKRKREVGVRYMKSWELERMWRDEARKEGFAEGHAEGLTEGLTEGKIQSILDLLGYLGEVPEDIKERINQETNQDTLAKWHMLAAKSDSISHFEKNM